MNSSMTLETKHLFYRSFQFKPTVHFKISFFFRMGSHLMKPAYNLKLFYTSIFLFSEVRICVQKCPMAVQGLLRFTDSSGRA
jgi:hypothetical protein